MDTSFVHGWYGPGIDAMVPEQYLYHTRTALSRYVPKMSLAQEHAFETFDIRPKVMEAQKAGLVDEFLELLDINQRNSARSA